MLDPKEAARAAHLRHVSDFRPGISRVWRDDGWDFIGTDGSVITDPDNITRIKKFNPSAVTRGRKQYRCHSKWREVRDEAKYGTMLVLTAYCRPFAPEWSTIWPAPAYLKKSAGRCRSTVGKDYAAFKKEWFARTNRPFGLSTLRRK